MRRCYLCGGAAHHTRVVVPKRVIVRRNALRYQRFVLASAVEVDPVIETARRLIDDESLHDRRVRVRSALELRFHRRLSRDT